MYILNMESVLFSEGSYDRSMAFKVGDHERMQIYSKITIAAIHSQHWGLHVFISEHNIDTR